MALRIMNMAGQVANTPMSTIEHPYRDGSSVAVGPADAETGESNGAYPPPMTMILVCVVNTLLWAAIVLAVRLVLSA